METVAENVRIKPYWLINRTVGLLSMNSYIVHLHLSHSDHFHAFIFVSFLHIVFSQVSPNVRNCGFLVEMFLVGIFREE